MKKLLGVLIREKLVEQERTTTWFANKLYIDRSNAYRIFKRNSIDTDLLMRISSVLNYDFFAELSEEFRDRQNSLQK